MTLIDDRVIENALSSRQASKNISGDLSASEKDAWWVLMTRYLLAHVL